MRSELRAIPGRAGFHHCTSQSAIETGQRFAIFNAPAGKQLCDKSPPRHRNRLNRSTPSGCYNRLAHTLIAHRLPARDQPKFRELGRLPADSRMVASHLFRKLDHAQRAGRTDPDEEREQGAIDRHTGFMQQDVVLPGTVQHANQIEQRRGEAVRIICIMHALHSSRRLL